MPCMSLVIGGAMVVTHCGLNKVAPPGVWLPALLTHEFVLFDLRQSSLYATGFFQNNFHGQDDPVPLYG